MNNFSRQLEKKNLQFVISGATGFVGKILVPRLLKQGYKVTLIGRDKKKIKKLFPMVDVADYQDLTGAISTEDIVINLAVANNHQNVSIEKARKVNVDLAIRLAAISAEAGASHFINISTIHALMPELKSAYAITKREAVDELKAISGIPVTHLYLPSIYGECFSGKLKFLNRFRDGQSSIVFRILKSFKPTLNIDVLTEWLCVLPTHFGIRKILTDTQLNNATYQFLKRLVDIIFCIFILLFFGWLMILVALIIPLTSHGPALFRHERVGQNGKLFTCFKFRSMAVDAVQVGTHEIDTGKITSVGKLIRKSKIDELPQIWNILANDMTLIGPRPCLPSQTELVALRKSAGIYSLKPGISGLAQINKIDMSDPKRLVEWDRRYLDLQCLALDFSIVFNTAIGSGQGDPAQRSK